jgi:hypothetical protein
MKTRRRARAFLIALFVAALLTSPARAAPPAAASRGFWGPIEWAMGSQRRMLQVATVGMCLALYIIMWRK